MDFKDIRGYNRQISILKNAVESKKINHFYLFDGEKGTGKKDVALAFSKSVLCKGKQGESCGACPSCTKFDTNNHPDFKILEPVKGFIKKEDVEDMIEDISIIPFEGGKKVFLIEDLELARPETQNLLLKTLEEPPSYVVIIILSSNSNAILKTILSRCQSISFYNENRREDLLESEDFYEIRDELVDIIGSLLKGNKIKAFNSIDFFVKNKDRTVEILDIMIYWFRDLAIYKEIGESALILNKDNFKNLELQSSVDIERIYDIIYKIETTKYNIERNVNFNLSIETMLLNI